MKALLAVINRKDVFAILPTGHEKLIIFQLLPDVCKYLCLSGYSYPHHAIILVVCPLKSLVDSHLRELRNRGISSASLRSEDVDENNLPKGTYSFVFGSPESFLQNEKWRHMLRSNVYQDRCGRSSCCSKMVSSINATFFRVATDFQIDSTNSAIVVRSKLG